MHVESSPLLDVGQLDLTDIDSLESWLSHAEWYDHNYRQHYRTPVNSRIPVNPTTSCSEKMSVVCAKESNSTNMTLKSINHSHSIKPYTSFSEKHSDDLSMTLKPPKSYGTYSEKQQEDVVAFIKDGNSLRTAEKVFGIPKSTMHCWLKKRKLKFEIVDSDGNSNSSNSETFHTVSTTSRVSDIKTESGNSSTSGRSQTQIIIEEAELIRFLQTDEGVDLIAKSHQVSKDEFRKFVCENKKIKPQVKKEDDGYPTMCSLDGNSYSRFNSSKDRNGSVDVIGLMKNGSNGRTTVKKYTIPKSGTSLNLLNDVKNRLDRSIRKRSCDGNVSLVYSSSSNGSLVASVTSSKSSLPTRTVILSPSIRLPPFQNVSKAGNVRSVLSNVPIRNTQSHLHNTQSMLQNQNNLLNNSTLQIPDIVVSHDIDKQPLVSPGRLSNSSTPESYISHPPSPTYPRQVSAMPNISVTIKKEPEDDFTFDGSDLLRSPLGLRLPPESQPINEPVAVTPISRTILNNMMNPVHSTSSSASLNLNEINRTQSEKELMALVGGEKVSADDLCIDFNELLALNNWIEHEEWYSDQYQQHFATSPAISPNPLTHQGLLHKSPSTTSLKELGEGADGLFMMTKSEKEKVVKYLAEGHTIDEAERHFDIPTNTVHSWLAQAASVKNQLQQAASVKNQLQQMSSSDSLLSIQHAKRKVQQPTLNSVTSSLLTNSMLNQKWSPDTLTNLSDLTNPPNAKRARKDSSTLEGLLRTKPSSTLLTTNLVTTSLTASSVTQSSIAPSQLLQDSIRHNVMPTSELTTNHSSGGRLSPSAQLSSELLSSQKYTNGEQSNASPLHDSWS